MCSVIHKKAYKQLLTFPDDINTYLQFYNTHMVHDDVKLKFWINFHVIKCKTYFIFVKNTCSFAHTQLINHWLDGKNIRFMWPLITREHIFFKPKQSMSRKYCCVYRSSLN